MTDKGKSLQQMVNQLNAEMRKLEILTSKFDHDTIWEVYKTNADIEQLELVHQGLDRDIAESKMTRLFAASGYEQDLMLHNRKTQMPMALLFSERTKQARGECQG